VTRGPSSARPARALGLVGLVVAAAALAPGAARGPLRAQEAPVRGAPAGLSRALARAVERAAPHLVRIRPRTDARRSRSGVVVAPGVVVTCASHVEVVGETDLVVVDAAGVERPAQLRGRDLRLRIVALTVPGLTAPPIEPTASPREAGRVVLALGAVLGDLPGAAPGLPRPGSNVTAALGIVSATNRFDGRADQIDAPLDASNIGGAVVDLEGHLVGIAVHVDERLGERSGVGFAVPPARIAAALPRLAAGDQLEPGWLGLVIPRDHDGLEGVLVKSVVAGSAAAAAGLEADDRVLSIDGRLTPDRRAFREVTVDLFAGQRVTLDVLRGDARRRFEATVAPRR
jgi:S1-C subfamily serine protease